MTECCPIANTPIRSLAISQESVSLRNAELIGVDLELIWVGNHSDLSIFPSKHDHILIERSKQHLQGLLGSGHFKVFKKLTLR